MPSRTLSVRALLVLTVALGSLGANPGSRIGADSSGSRLGEKLMRSGRTDMAVRLFESALKDDPEDPAARIGLGIALATMGQCRQAAESFDGFRDQQKFRYESYLAEGTCALEDGDLALAIERLEEAATFNIRRPEAVYHLVLALQQAGHVEEAHAALDELQWRRESDAMHDVARLYVALGTEAFPFEWAALEREVRRTGLTPLTEGHASFLKGRALLLDGAPELAGVELKVAVRSSLRDQHYALWRAEASRRSGDVESARYSVDRKAIAQADPLPLAFAIRSRIATDEGDFETAQAELDRHPTHNDPEYFASAWYLARARGEDTSALEAAYGVLRHPDSGDLSLLIPRSAP